MSQPPDPSPVSIRNRADLESSQSCGCYFCLSVYSPQLIQRWIDSNQTALCPHCGIDSVISGDSFRSLECFKVYLETLKTLDFDVPRDWPSA
ncbi:MAG: hypothetical protein P1V97_07985 [Planctomycetota bacterium]|nr:hypothetical protein [Planctomycetota bacterium]